MAPQRPLFGGDFLGQILAVDSLPGAFVHSDTFIKACPPVSRIGIHDAAPICTAMLLHTRGVLLVYLDFAWALGPLNQ